MILAEIELSPDEPRLRRPPLAVGDVTDDDRFSGGRLATTTSGELQSLLALIAAEPTS
jgi:CYTH domain-containing protein